MNSIPGVSQIGEYTDKEICEAIEMAFIALTKYPQVNVQMLSAGLILLDVYTRIAEHNNLKFGSIEEIYKNFIDNKEKLNIIKGL